MGTTGAQGGNATTREEWYDICMKRGARGDQVFSILADWKKATLGYPSPISTDDELPPEGEDILWWWSRERGRGWKAGHFEADKEVAPGFLIAGRYRWYLCNGRIGDGSTWWMYPPPPPEKK